MSSDVRYSSCQELRDPLLQMVHTKPRSRSSPSSPNPRHHLTHRQMDNPLCSTQSSLNTNSMNSTKFRSISVNGITGGLARVPDRQTRYSWHYDNSCTDPIEEVMSPDNGSVLSDDEVIWCTLVGILLVFYAPQYLSSTKELIHIRYILSTADLVNLQLYNNKMYREIVRGKVWSYRYTRRCWTIVTVFCTSYVVLVRVDGFPSCHAHTLVWCVRSEWCCIIYVFMVCSI